MAFHRPLYSMLVAVAACAPSSADDGGDLASTGSAASATLTLTDASTTATTTASDPDAGSGPVTGGVDSTTDDTGPGSDCTFCDGPNEACIDDVCVTTCQGQQPDPCGPAQVCDVISGQCHDPSDPCTLAGPYIGCGAARCGPGSVCDDQGACVPVAPCGDVACLDDGSCWGTACQCTRASTCAGPPDETALNGPFSVDIGDLEFADDCTAWMVTLRSGTDYVRRLAPDGTLTEWAGVANLNMGEIKVLKALAPPAGIATGNPTTLGGAPRREGPSDGFRRPPAAGVEGLGEVAITYTCCPTCGCFVDPPQGVARLIENDPDPLPIVIEAVPTQGTGPFGNTPADAGPQGLTWGIDRVLYVGNSSANGELNSADLDMGTQATLGSLPSRITAGAPISPVHNLFALDNGELYIFNVETASNISIATLPAGVTSLSHDAFSGIVYAALGDLSIVEIRPFSADVQPFGMMPTIGRVSVSPDGQLWHVPLRIVVGPEPISAWDLPDAL